MYNTVEELHIALDQSLQNINSNRRGIIKPQEKDWLLNETQFRLIDIIMDARKTKGYEDDQLNYDALLPVKELVELPIIPIDNKSGYAILPSDYLHRDSLAANVVFNCGDVPKAIKINRVVMELTIPEDNNNPKYDDFTITITSDMSFIDIFKLSDYGYSGFNKSKSFFIIVGLVIDALREQGFDVYWERYNDIYKRNTFFIIPTTTTISTITSIDATYGNTSINGTFDIQEYRVNIETGYKVIDNTPTGLVSTEDINDMLKSSFFNTVPDKPIITLSKHIVTVYYTNDWFINRVKLRYIKRPMLINSIAGQMTNLKNISDKIVQMTVQNIKAKIEDRGYQAIVNENLITN